MNMSEKADVIPLPDERPALTYEMDEIGRYFAQLGDRKAKLLEVGCGTRSAVGSRLRDRNNQFQLHGIDIDPYAAGNEYVDEVVLADATRMPFKDEVYEVVVSHYMLEHLKDCRQTLEEMSRVVAKGGLMVLVFPNPTAPDSLMTRLTPFKFHVFFRRMVQRRPDAERRSFPTFFSFGTVGNVVGWLRKNGFSDIKAVFFAETFYRFRTWRLIGRFMILYCKLLTSLGLNGLMSSVVIIARK
jgi:ubiquinone/menaquinone biosynthesis C-methylase UbiE